MTSSKGSALILQLVSLRLNVFIILISTLFSEETFNLKLDLLFSWANLDYGEEKDMFWHTHPYDYSCIYYMKTNNDYGGTLFKDKSLNFVTAMQNSLILFNASLEHTAPPYPFHQKRYTLVAFLLFVSKTKTLRI